jgi:hypothetical protein
MRPEPACEIRGDRWDEERVLAGLDLCPGSF